MDNTYNNILNTFPKDEIIETLNQINSQIGSLHSISSKDFLYFNKLLKDYYKQIKDISEANVTIVNFFSAELSQLLEMLIDSNQKKQKISAKAKDFAENYVKKISLSHNSFNLLTVPYNNFKQNLGTLKYVLANLNLHLLYINMNKKDELKTLLSNVESIINQLLNKLDFSRSHADSLVLSIIENKNRACDLLTTTKHEFDKLTEQLTIEHKTLSTNNYFSQSHYLNINTHLQNCFANMGEIITNIQYHDIIRQKMEHIQASQNELIMGLDKMPQTQATNDETLSFIVKIPEITDIQVAQLLYTNKDYQSSIERITQKLISVGYEMKTLSDIYQSVVNDCSQFNEKIINKTNLAQTDFCYFYKHFITEWQDEIKHINTIEQEYQSLKTNFSDLFNLEKNLRASINQIKKILSENGNMFGNELCGRFNNMITELQQNSNSIKIQFNLITNQLKDLQTEASQILIKNNYDTETNKPQNQLEEQNKKVLKVSHELSNQSLTLSESLSASLKNIEYYNYFNNTVDKIVKQLNHISEQINIDNIKQMSGVDDILLKKVEKMYTMKSERDVHQQVLQHGDTILDNQNNAPTDIDENDLELF